MYLVGVFSPPLPPPPQALVNPGSSIVMDHFVA
jgi:hypothetical protein